MYTCAKGTGAIGDTCADVIWAIRNMCEKGADVIRVYVCNRYRRNLCIRIQKV